MPTIKMDATGPITLLSAMVDNLPKAVALITKKTAKAGMTEMARLIKEELVITSKDVKKDMYIKFPTPASATLGIRRNSRFSLKRFKPTQKKGSKNRTGGVSYRASRTAGRVMIPHAFIVDKLGGHVFIRGSKRVPPINKRMKSKPNREAIFKLYGPSPWGVLSSNNRTPRLQQILQTRLEKEIQESLRVNKLRQAKQLRNQST